MLSKVTSYLLSLFELLGPLSVEGVYPDFVLRVLVLQKSLKVELEPKEKLRRMRTSVTELRDK